MMAGGYPSCCCVCADGTKIYADGRVTWIEHEVVDGDGEVTIDDGTITVTVGTIEIIEGTIVIDGTTYDTDDSPVSVSGGDEVLVLGTIVINDDADEVDTGSIIVPTKEGPCKTYWVESAAGDQNETGTGTEDDPWVNINTVFGTSVDFDVDVVACIKYICTNQVCDKKCPKVKVLVKGTIDYTVDGTSADYSRNLIFEPWDNPTFTITDAGFVEGVICKQMVASGSVYLGVAADIAVIEGRSSTFISCDLHIADDGTSTYGFACRESTIEACTVTSEEDIQSNLIYGVFNTDGTVRGCSVTVTNDDRSIGVSCPNSFIDNCNATANGSGAGQQKSWGFYRCLNSVIRNCNGVGSADITGACVFACGFYDNTGASIVDSTTSATICDSCGNPCPWSCDSA